MKKIKQKIKIPLGKVLKQVFEVGAFLSMKMTAYFHRQLKWVEWRVLPQPEFFDHHIDLFYQWLQTRNSLWLERGVFSSLALKGGDVLELGCGDGFNARNFYSLRSQQIIACDFDTEAIKIAQKKNSTQNVKYLLADIRTDMPKGSFDNIIWDASIEHFTPDEISAIMKNIRSRLKSGEVVSGYTLVEKEGGDKSLSHHEYEFKDKRDLLRFLTPHFKHVSVFETIFPNRHNLYFWASDEIIPFAENWDKVVRN